MESLVLFFNICTANTTSLYSCLRVWEYLPPYINDYVEFKVCKPYYKEKQALDFNKNLSGDLTY